MPWKVPYKDRRRGVCIWSPLVHSYGKIIRFDIGFERAHLVSRLRCRHPESILVGPTGVDKSFSSHPAGWTSQASEENNSKDRDQKFVVSSIAQLDGFPRYSTTSVSTSWVYRTITRDLASPVASLSTANIPSAGILR